jgi:hypothetical protein
MMRGMLLALMACVVLAAVWGCAYYPANGPKLYQAQSEKITKPTEVEFSSWNIFGMIGGSKIRVEAEEQGDDD